MYTSFSLVSHIPMALDILARSLYEFIIQCWLKTFDIILDTYTLNLYTWKIFNVETAFEISWGKANCNIRVVAIIYKIWRNIHWIWMITNFQFIKTANRIQVLDIISLKALYWYYFRIRFFKNAYLASNLVPCATIVRLFSRFTFSSHLQFSWV